MEPDRVFPLRDQARGATVTTCEMALPTLDFIVPVVGDLPETSIVTHVGDPGSGTFDPALLYPTPQGRMVLAERRGPIEFEVLAAGVTNDPTLRTHFADDQTSLDLALDRFGAFIPTDTRLTSSTWSPAIASWHREGRCWTWVPADDASIDGIVVAQAFHWFDGPAALREFARLLRRPRPRTWRRCRPVAAIAPTTSG